MTESKIKQGRPKKEQKGQMVWVPSDYVKAIKAFLNELKQPSQQAQQ
jgi:hypothetical protein